MYVTHWEGIRCAWRVQTSTESRGQINLATLLFTECNFDLLFHLFDYISGELWCEKGAYTGASPCFREIQLITLFYIVYPKLMNNFMCIILSKDLNKFYPDCIKALGFGGKMLSQFETITISFLEDYPI